MPKTKITRLLSKVLAWEKGHISEIKDVIREENARFLSLAVNERAGERFLHFYARRGSSEEILQFLIAADPEALSAKDQSGQTPLHIASAIHDNRFVWRLLQHHPDAAKEQDFAGNLPLHLAFKDIGDHQPPSQTIARLINAYPDGRMIRNQNGLLPIQLSIESLLSRRIPILVKANDVAIIEHMVRKCSAGLDEYDEHGHSILHRLCARCKVLGVWPPPKAVNAIMLVTDACPDVCKVVDKQGQLPLHILCNASYEELADAILHIVRKHPQACRVADDRGQLPLHIACMAACHSAALIKLLVQVYPDSVLQRDSFGNLPLHYACSNVFDTKEHEIVEILVAANPGALWERNSDGKLPIEQALQRIGQMICDSSLYEPIFKLIRFLINSCPRRAQMGTVDANISISIPDSKGRLPLHNVFFYWENMLEDASDDDGAEDDDISETGFGVRHHNNDQDSGGELDDGDGVDEGEFEDDKAEQEWSCGAFQFRVIQAIIDRNPESAYALDNQKNTPLVYACVNNASPALIMLLTQHSLPVFEDASSKNNKRRLPNR